MSAQPSLTASAVSLLRKINVHIDTARSRRDVMTAEEKRTWAETAVRLFHMSRGERSAAYGFDEEAKVLSEFVTEFGEPEWRAWAKGMYAPEPTFPMLESELEELRDANLLEGKEYEQLRSVLAFAALHGTGVPVLELPERLGYYVRPKRTLTSNELQFKARVETLFAGHLVGGPRVPTGSWEMYKDMFGRIPFERPPADTDVSEGASPVAPRRLAPSERRAASAALRGGSGSTRTRVGSGSRARSQAPAVQANARTSSQAPAKADGARAGGVVTTQDAEGWAKVRQVYEAGGFDGQHRKAKANTCDVTIMPNGVMKCSKCLQGRVGRAAASVAMPVTDLIASAPPTGANGAVENRVEVQAASAMPATSQASVPKVANIAPGTAAHMPEAVQNAMRLAPATNPAAATATAVNSAPSKTAAPQPGPVKPAVGHGTVAKAVVLQAASPKLTTAPTKPTAAQGTVAKASVTKRGRKRSPSPLAKPGPSKVPAIAAKSPKQVPGASEATPIVVDPEHSPQIVLDRRPLGPFRVDDREHFSTPLRDWLPVGRKPRTTDRIAEELRNLDDNPPDSSEVPSVSDIHEVARAMAHGVPDDAALSVIDVETVRFLRVKRIETMVEMRVLADLYAHLYETEAQVVNNAGEKAESFLDEDEHSSVEQPEGSSVDEDEDSSMDEGEDSSVEGQERQAAVGVI
ncbi:hypothetical protein BV25DRAFT_1922324 [Artomyces pyxidatus]|uniref:Uncharacterized protein n=1 Tax=Artomyces pyxidatus TaxID=48021 RepID=A0ACB8SG31_9AGAM|nr:hypothetical protein BV25DRAFT_1922324 [Artomyces pyxidatus]